MSQPISFLSDFGLEDEFVGVVHGVLATLAPESRVIDVTHHIAPGDVRAGALALMRAIQYLPKGVALAVVDPGVGTGRRAIAARTPWGVFVGPDNGLLTPAVQMVGGADVVVAIENPDLRLPSAGATFEGRDRFAPAAAVLASGEATLDDLGPPIPGGELTPLLLPLPEVDERGVLGEAWWIDRFGNVQTNVSPDDLARAGIRPGDRVRIVVAQTVHEAPFVATYGDVAPGELLVHVDSWGLVALAVRQGRADERLGISTGTAVRFAPVAAPSAATSSDG